MIDMKYYISDSYIDTTDMNPRTDIRIFDNKYGIGEDRLQRCTVKFDGSKLTLSFSGSDPLEIIDLNMNEKIINGVKYIPINQAHMLDNKYLKYKIIEAIRTNVTHSDYLSKCDCCDPSDLDNFILLLVTRMQMTEEPKPLVLVEGDSTGGDTGYKNANYQTLFKFRGKSSNI